jgi:hypothetical protein
LSQWKGRVPRVATVPPASLSAARIAQPCRQRHHAWSHHNRHVCQSREKFMHRIRLRFDPVERNSTLLIAIGESAPLQQALASLGKLWSFLCRLSHSHKVPQTRKGRPATGRPFL